MGLRAQRASFRRTRASLDRRRVRISLHIMAILMDSVCLRVCPSEYSNFIVDKHQVGRIWCVRSVVTLVVHVGTAVWRRH